MEFNPETFDSELHKIHAISVNTLKEMHKISSDNMLKLKLK